jgi:protein arginine N-methyltransferase 3
MAPMGDELAAAAGREGQVLVRPVELAALVTPSVRVHDMDLVTMTPGQQDFTAIFTLTPAAGRDGSSGSVSVSAIVLWFDVEFSERFCRECPVTLSTSPAAECTHWAQAVLPLKQPVQLAADGSSSSSSLACRLSMARNRGKHRCLDISLEVTPAGGDDSARQTVVFSMGVNSSN